MQLDGIEFSKYLQKLNLSNNTIQSYLLDIKHFINWCKLKSGEDDYNSAKEYADCLTELLVPASVNRKISSLNKYLAFKGYNERLPFLKIERQEFYEDFLSNQNVRKIFKKAIQKNDYRAVALIAVLYYTGGRISEVLQIKTKDIDKNSVLIKGKGSKYRELLISKELQKHLKIYAKSKAKQTVYLFTGKKKNSPSITRNTAHVILKNYCVLADIDQGLIHAHAFRHLFAQNLAKKNINPVIIAQLLGHSLNVTGTYIRYSKKDLLKIIDSLKL